jgi:hypothetical protein
VRELIQLLVEQLVNNPGAVEIKEARADTASVIELRVAKEDLGRVIGRQGAHCSGAPNNPQRHRIAKQPQSDSPDHRREGRRVEAGTSTLELREIKA